MSITGELARARAELAATTLLAKAEAAAARERAAATADIDLADVDAIAVTAGPGLMGALVVGLASAKALSAYLNKPLYGVNHLVGHVAVERADGDRRRRSAA